MRLSSTLAAVLVAFPAAAQDAPAAAPDRAADLAGILSRAETNDATRDSLMLLRRYAERGSLDPAFFAGLFNVQPPSPGQPLLYREMPLIRAAQLRGQTLGEIISSDIDNDGSITRKEVRLTAQVGRSNMIAEFFLRNDVDDDNILTPAEIKDGVEQRVSEVLQSRNGDRAKSFGLLLDLDGDGAITAEEMERAIAALSP